VIVRSDVSPAGNGPVVGDTSVRASHPIGVPTRCVRYVADELARTEHLQRLIAERNPSLQDLLLERDPYPEFYTPLAVMFEDNVRGLVHDWNGRVPK
jgi:hypothetical protein